MVQSAVGVGPYQATINHDSAGAGDGRDLGSAAVSLSSSSGQSGEPKDEGITGSIQSLGNNRQGHGPEEAQALKKKQKQNSKIKKLISKKQQQKEQTLSTPKLLAKTQALRINPEAKERENAQTQRYFHICIDKLALAFEKQFLKDLPEYGNYKRQDQEYSPTSYNRRKDVYGYDETHVRNNRDANRRVKPSDILAQAQGTFLTAGQAQKSAAPAIVSQANAVHSSKPPAAGGAITHPFFHSAAIPLHRKPSSASAASVHDEIAEYTVYKSKLDFDRLRRDIKN